LARARPILYDGRKSIKNEPSREEAMNFVKRASIWTAAAALGGALGIGGAAAQTVAISTLPPGAINNVQAAAIAKAIQEKSDLQMRLITFNSPAAIISAVQNKQGEFAYTSNEEASDAFKGRRP
jgi:hypothetical protein